MTLRSLRDADAERLMCPGERLLGAVVATRRRASLERVSGADRLLTPCWALWSQLSSATWQGDRAGSAQWTTGQRMVDSHLRLTEEALNWDPAEVTVPPVPAIPPGADPMSVMLRRNRARDCNGRHRRCQPKRLLARNGSPPT